MSSLRYNHFYIQKSNGRTRKISSPTPELKQRSYDLLDRIEARIQGSGLYNICTPYLHSYMKNRGCTTLVNEITEYLADTKHYDIYYLDVVNYFGSIHYTHWVAASTRLNTFLGEEFISPDQRLEIWNCAVEEDQDEVKIAQGNPLSPMISNLVGWSKIDRYLKPENNGLAAWAPCRYWRYSDNIFLVVKRVPGYSREDFLEKLYLITEHEITSRFKFKIKVLSNNQTNIALGIRIGKKTQLKDKKWMRSVFHRYAIKGDNLANDQDIIQEYGILNREATRRLVQGLAAYALDVDPSMGPYINSKLGSNNRGDQGHQALQQEGPQES